MDDNHDIYIYRSWYTIILCIIYILYIYIYISWYTIILLLYYTAIHIYSFQTWNQSCTQDRGWKSQGIKMGRKIRPDPLHCRYIHLLPPAPQGRRFEALPGEIPEPLSMRLLERQWIVLAVVIVSFSGKLGHLIGIRRYHELWPPAATEASPSSSSFMVFNLHICTPGRHGFVLAGLGGLVCCRLTLPRCPVWSCGFSTQVANWPSSGNGKMEETKMQGTESSPLESRQTRW